MIFPCVRERVVRGRPRLHGWSFDIGACALQVFDPSSQSFQPVE